MHADCYGGYDRRIARDKVVYYQGKINEYTKLAKAVPTLPSVVL
jgi:hypothetical protein